MSETVTPTKGVGEIQISWNAVADLLQSSLLLPPGYTITRAYGIGLPTDLSGGLIVARVEAPTIPIVEDGQPLPAVTPYYRRDEQGKVTLERIVVDGKEVYNVDEVGKEDIPHD